MLIPTHDSVYRYLKDCYFASRMFLYQINNFLYIFQDSFYGRVRFRRSNSYIPFVLLSEVACAKPDVNPRSSSIWELSIQISFQPISLSSYIVLLTISTSPSLHSLNNIESWLSDYLQWLLDHLIISVTFRISPSLVSLNNIDPVTIWLSDYQIVLRNYPIACTTWSI
jgi:hypothetical protein